MHFQKAIIGVKRQREEDCFLWREEDCFLWREEDSFLWRFSIVCLTILLSARLACETFLHSTKAAMPNIQQGLTQLFHASDTVL